MNYKSLCVLIIDDNAVNRLVTMNLLRLLNVYTEEASNSKEAVKMIESRNYDLILMDYLMPDMDGLELTSLIRSLPGEKGRVAIAGVSANFDDEIKRKFLNAGAFTVLNKPIEIESLKNILSLLYSVQFGEKNKWKYDFFLREDSEHYAKAKTDYIRVEMLKIYELDYEYGIRYALGDPITYMKIIKVSIISLRQCMNKVHLHVKQGDSVGYQHDFHSLKSVLMYIGATRLAKKAGEIESLLCSSIEVLDNIQSFLFELKNLIIALEHAIESYNMVEAEDRNKEKYFAENLPEEIKKRRVNYKKDVEYYAKRFEYEKMLESLKGWLLNAEDVEEEEVKRAILAAEYFDYEQVLSIIDNSNCT